MSPEARAGRGPLAAILAKRRAAGCQVGANSSPHPPPPTPDPRFLRCSLHFLGMALVELSPRLLLGAPGNKRPRAQNRALVSKDCTSKAQSSPLAPGDARRGPDGALARAESRVLGSGSNAGSPRTRSPGGLSDPRPALWRSLFRLAPSPPLRARLPGLAALSQAGRGEDLAGESSAQTRSSAPALAPSRRRLRPAPPTCKLLRVAGAGSSEPSTRPAGSAFARTFQSLTQPLLHGSEVFPGPQTVSRCAV